MLGNTLFVAVLLAFVPVAAFVLFVAELFVGALVLVKPSDGDEILLVVIAELLVAALVALFAVLDDLKLFFAD